MKQSPGTCLNCGQAYQPDHDYCPNCGQSTHIHRLNFHEVMHELQHSIFHVDSGIWYTIRGLLTRPGAAVSEYIQGARKKHFKPVLLVLILSAIYTLLIYKVFHFQDEFIEINIPNGQNVPQDAIQDINFENIKQVINQTIREKYGFVMLALTPLLALSLRIAFLRQKKFNLTEYFFISVFGTAQSILFLILFSPILYFTQHHPFWTGILNLVLVIGFMWMLRGLFPEKSLGFIISRSLAAFILFLFFIFLVILLIMAGYASFYNLKV